MIKTEQECNFLNCFNLSKWDSKPSKSASYAIQETFGLVKTRS